MKTLFGALALLIAVPAAAQTAPATSPHAGHAQHGQQHGQHGGTAHHDGMAHQDHAKMMDECKKAMTEGKCKEHCEAMMKQHGAAVAAPAAKPEAHQGHAH